MHSNEPPWHARARTRAAAARAGTRCARGHRYLGVRSPYDRHCFLYFRLSLRYHKVGPEAVAKMIDLIHLVHNLRHEFVFAAHDLNPVWNSKRLSLYVIKRAFENIAEFPIKWLSSVLSSVTQWCVIHGARYACKQRLELHERGRDADSE